MNSHQNTDDHELPDTGFPLLNGDMESKKSESRPTNEILTENKIAIELEPVEIKPLIYRVSQNPPPYLTVAFAFQQVLLLMANPLSTTLIISELVCMQSDEELKLQVLSSILFIVGLSTFLMVTFGVRLPIFQGPASSYIIPLVAMTTVKEWTCPATFKQFDPATNKTILMVNVDNSTVIPSRDLSLKKIGELSGSLMAVGVVHTLIGLTGLVGYLIRYIGPITIVPTIVMIGLKIYTVVVKFMEPHMGISFIVIICNLIFSLLLGKKETPIPWWNRQKGFHIFWYPLHTTLSILFSVLVGWGVAAILTELGVLTDDPENKEFLARTDARNFIIEQTSWFLLPYPGKFGSFVVNPGVFINFLIASLLSVLDSIGDYAAAARVARVTPPPHFAFNRGIAVEGLMSSLAGAMGSCTATVSYGSAIGAMGITRVVSLRVFQGLGLIFLICSVIGKIGAFFITIPYPVLGGTTLITIGLFIGVVLSYLQTVDLTSTRNLAIIGISLLLGLALPHWVSRNGDSINTGNRSLDIIIQMLLANASLVAGVFSCLMDNIVPGTLKERGITEQLKDLDEGEGEDESDIVKKDVSSFYEDGPEIYRLPYLPNIIRQSRMARRLLPIFDYENPKVNGEVHQVKL